MFLIKFFSLIIIVNAFITNTFAYNTKYIRLEPTNNCASNLYQKLTEEKRNQLTISLFDAIENNDYQAARKALEAGVPPNTIKITTLPNKIRPVVRSALHAAVFTGNPLIVKLLLEFGAIPVLKVDDHLTAFPYLAYQHHISNADKRAITELFIATGIDQKYIDEAFHHAAIAMNLLVGEVIYEQAGPSRRIDAILNTNYTLVDKLTYLVGLFTASLSMQEDIETKYKYARLAHYIHQRRLEQQDRHFLMKALSIDNDTND